MTYLEMTFNCKVCDWIGKGKDAIVDIYCIGEEVENPDPEKILLYCPKCEDGGDLKIKD